MPSEVSTKFRLVRCPRCRNLLPELADVPVYKCGGCGAVLQAKRRRNDPSTGSELFEAGAAVNNGLVHVSEDKESNTSTRLGSHEEGAPLSNGFDHVLEDDTSTSSGIPKAGAALNNGLDHVSEDKGSNTRVTSGSHEESAAALRIGFDHVSGDDTSPGSGLPEAGAALNNGLGHVSEDEESNTSMRSGSHEESAALSNGFDHVSEDKESTQLSEKLERLASEVVNLSDEDKVHDGNDDNKHRDFECEHQGSVTSTDQSDDDKPVDVLGEKAEVTDTSNLVQEDRSDGNECGECSGDCGGSFRHEYPIVANLPSDREENELDQHKTREFRGQLARDFDDGPEASHSFSKENCDGSNQDKRDSCNGESMGNTDNKQSGDLNQEIEDKKNVVDERDPGNFDAERCGFINEVTSQSEPIYQDVGRTSLLLRENSEKDTADDASSLPPAEIEVQVKNNNDGHSRKSNADNLEARREVASIVTTHRPTRNSFSSDILLSSPNEQLEPSQRSFHGRIRSTDTIATTEYGDHSSELSGNFGGPSKFSNIRSSHAYDASVSSYDGTEYYIPHTRLRRDKQLMNAKMNQSAEMQGLKRHSLSASSEKKPYSVRSRRTYRDKYPESSEHHNPVGNQMRSDNEEHPYASPFYGKGINNDYESGVPSEFQSNSSCYYSPGKLESNEWERTKLLHLLYELQNQLNKTRDSGGLSAGGVFTEDTQREQKFRIYSNRGYPDVKTPHDFGDLRYPGMHRGARNLTEYRVPHIPYSAEVPYDRHYINHHFLLDWRYSAPLPPPIPYPNNGIHNVYPGGYSPYSSYVSSPTRYVDSKLLFRSGEVLSDYQMWKHHATRKDLKEKHLSDKRHLLPIAGGAPFITCYHCLNLLQLPAEFLLVKRRYHRLRCGYCSELLKFSLQNSVHIVPYIGNSDSPTCDSDEVTNFSNMENVASSSRGNDNPQVDPLSYPDNYENSFRKSCSTEDSYLTASQSLQDNKIGNIACAVSAASSSQLQSENIALETREDPRASSSPLHRLMGYSSPRHLIIGSEMSSGG